MAKQTDGNGKGASKHTTAEEQNEKRRAAKARQKRGRGNGQQTGGYLDGLIADRQQRATERRQQREAEEYFFRTEQARLAKTHEWFGQLRAGSLAYKIAHAVVDAFALAEPFEENGKKVSRTDSAVAEVIGSLSDKEVTAEGAIRHGVTVAKKALSWGYAEAKKEQDAKSSTELVDAS